MPHCKITTDLNKLHVHVLATLMIISILRLKKMLSFAQINCCLVFVRS